MARSPRIVAFAAAWAGLASVGTALADGAACARAPDAPFGWHARDPASAVALYGPPPEAGSDAQRLDLARVHELQQAARGTPRREQAIADAEASCKRFADTLGTGLPPQVLVFLDQAAEEASALTGAAKRQYHRPRPYIADPTVERLADVAARPGEAAASQRDFASYPSGHSAFGTTCGLLLAQMVPERGAALFERGRAYGESREIVGAHFPRDVEAGRIAAALAVGDLQEDACFRADFARARAVLRAALALPAEPAR